jgi:ATP-dependent RNA helicase RhlE
MDILVATPGRIFDLATTGVLRLKGVQKLVIDEVDEMLGLGFRSQLNDLLELLPKQRQNLMFSATLTPDVNTFINRSIINPSKIEIAPHGTPIESIIQRAYHVPNFNTKAHLLELLITEDPELNKVLIFVATKKLADRLFEHVEKIFPGQFGVMHSNKSHNQRMNALKQFQEGQHRFLIATDIIARGMDITDVSHVINFDLPEVPGDYLHRIGRTGRADKAGVAISFINENEQVFQTVIETLMKKPIPINPLPENLIISKIYSEEERPTRLFDKNYMKGPSIKGSKGAFHEKKKKNLKVNLGGPGRRDPKFHKSPIKKRGNKPK